VPRAYPSPVLAAQRCVSVTEGLTLAGECTSASLAGGTYEWGLPAAHREAMSSMPGERGDVTSALALTRHPREKGEDASPPLYLFADRCARRGLLKVLARLM
jgi:hypothetical protein